MAYNTGNPSGSSDPRDLSDSAADIDTWATSTTTDTHPDRLGVSRKTWYGMENEFDADQAARASEFEADQDSREAQFVQLMVSGGYTGTGVDGAVEEYAAGITVSAYKEIIRDGGEFWRAAADTTLPYTTTGAGMPEGGAFVSVGDAVLRQELAADSGATLVGYSSSLTVAEALDQRGVRFIALRAPTSGTFDPEDYLETSTQIQLGAYATVLSHHAPSDYAIYAEARPYRGGQTYEIVSAGTGTDDGGSFINLSGSGLQAKGLFIEGFATICQFGALHLSGYDSTSALQAAFAYSSQLFADRFDPRSIPLHIEEGEFRTTETLTFVSPWGGKIVGAGMQKSVIYNDANANGILDIGIATESALQFGSIDFIWLRGNSLTEYGMKVFGNDDAMSRTSRANSSRNVYISEVGSGPGLILNAWMWQFDSLNIWNCYEGIEFSRGVNGAVFNTVYLSSCVGCSIVTSDTLNVNTATSAAINFNGGAIQRCGISTGKRGQLDIRAGRSWSFNGVFWEGVEDTGGGTKDAYIYSETEVNVSSGLLNPRTHGAGALGPNGIFIWNEGGVANVSGGFAVTGDSIAALVRNSGSFPRTTVKGLVGASNLDEIVDDVSTDGSYTISAVQGNGSFGAGITHSGGDFRLYGGAHRIGDAFNIASTAGEGSVLAGFLWQHQSASSQPAASSWLRHYYGATQSLSILNNGNLQNTNGVYGTISDARLKKITGKPRSYLADLLKLDLVKYLLLSDVEQRGDEAQEMIGLIAQDVQKVMPGLVGETDDGYLYIKTSILTLMLLQAVQEMNA